MKGKKISATEGKRNEPANNLRSVTLKKLMRISAFLWEFFNKIIMGTNHSKKTSVLG